MKGNGGADETDLRKARQLRGSGGMPPRKNLKFRVLLVHSGVVLVLLN